MRLTHRGRNLITAVAAAAIVLSVATLPASGLIIMAPASPSTPISNNAAPTGTYADFPYWNNMLGLHTYLGNGYLLTANHVLPSSTLPGSIVINGTSYNRVDQHRITHGAALTDLWIWKIDGGANPLPSLPAIPIITSSPVAGEELLMIGDGRSRSGGPTFWDIDFAASPDTWTPIVNEAAADAKGFEAGSHLKQWGTNAVAGAATLNLSGTTTQGYFTTFAIAGGTSFEAQATNDDSSGPVFVERGGQWQLTGLMHGVNTPFEGQPTSPGFAGIYSYVNPSLPGSTASLTGISDLSAYLTQVPEPTGAATLILCGAALLARHRHRHSAFR